VLAKLYVDTQTLRYPKQYVLENGAVQREHRPVSDVIFHVLLFKWGVIGDGWLFDRVMARINAGFVEWDTPFASPAVAARAVHAFCSRWGVPVDPWPWSKPAEQYATLNDWFTRSYSAEFAPESHLGEAAVLACATAVVTWFPSVAEMPQLVKNDEFTVDDVGFPPDFVRRCKAHPCTLHYLAPADYHCYHSPVSGTVTACALLLHGRYSVTVKPYILASTNILKRNRRAVLVIDCGDYSVGLVIIGGVTVDSIRLEGWLKAGAAVQRGQRLGAFARGGSSIAMFFTKTGRLTDACAAVVGAGRDFKLDCGRDLMSFPA
jgi:phosphatidylserine decarboxylase